MRWGVQFGIDSTSDVWKFWQNFEKLLNYFIQLLWKTIFNVNIYFFFEPKFWSFSSYFIQYFCLNSSGPVPFIEMSFRYFVCFENH